MIYSVSIEDAGTFDLMLIKRGATDQDIADIRQLCEERHPHSPDEDIAWLAVHRLLRSAPASRETGLDAERLARALHAFYAGKDTRDEFFPADCRHREEAGIIAVAYAADDPNEAIAAEYARAAASPVPAENAEA